MELSTNLKTHKAIVKTGKELKEFLLTGEQFQAIVIEMNAKSDFILIEGNFIKRYNIDKIEPLSDLDRQEIARREGQNIIFYEANEIAGRHTKTGVPVRRFIKYRELLRKKSEGGAKVEEVSSYYGYFTGIAGKIVKIEKTDLYLPSKEETLKVKEKFNNY